MPFGRVLCLSFGLTGRMGNNKQALQLIIQEENDVKKVIGLVLFSNQRPFGQ